MQGIMFGEQHSYRDFNLITNLINIGIPSVKTNYVDVPCGDGSLDLTDAMGGVKYSNRTLDMEFTLFATSERSKSNITNSIHGKRLRLILDKDNNFYYMGRCHVNEFKNDGSMSKLVITADCEPYKYKIIPTVHREIIEERKNFICINNGRTVTPAIETSSTMNAGVNGKLYELSAGKHKVLEIQFVPGYNRVTAVGNGTITFTYQEGVL